MILWIKLRAFFGPFVIFSLAKCSFGQFVFWRNVLAKFPRFEFVILLSHRRLPGLQVSATAPDLNHWIFAPPSKMSTEGKQIMDWDSRLRGRNLNARKTNGQSLTMLIRGKKASGLPLG